MSFMDKTKTKGENTTNTTTSYTITGNYPKTNKYGWICPVCGRGVSPDQNYCNCRPGGYYPYYPYYPYYQPYVTWCSSGPTCTSTTTSTSGSATINAQEYTGATTASTVGYINNFGINPDAQERSVNEKL